MKSTEFAPKANFRSVIGSYCVLENGSFSCKSNKRIAARSEDEDKDMEPTS
jgi:hypothetical protein